jgi:hypothetical protein
MAFSPSPSILIFEGKCFLLASGHAFLAVCLGHNSLLSFDQPRDRKEGIYYSQTMAKKGILLVSP